eukprot:9617135-Alexandrium_andersonii.AAC.1
MCKVGGETVTERFGPRACPHRSTPKQSASPRSHPAAHGASWKSASTCPNSARSQTSSPPGG